MVGTGTNGFAEIRVNCDKNSLNSSGVNEMAASHQFEPERKAVYAVNENPINPNANRLLLFSMYRHGSITGQ